MTVPSSPVRALRARLARLRRRTRALFAVQGIARWLLGALALLAAFFLADWILDLPLGVRRFVRLGLLDRPEGLAEPAWLVLALAALVLTVASTRARLGAAPVFAFAAAGAAGVLGWLAFRVLRPVGTSLSDEDLALSVEHRFRSLNDRLAAALDFERELGHPSRGESEDMMRAVVDEAAREAEGLEFARAVSARRALRWTGVALLALVVAGGIAWAATDAVSLWARRSLLLEDRAWPRATTLLAVDVDADGTATDHPAEEPFEVVLGRPFVVHARAEGRVPDEVLLVDLVEGARELPRRMFAVPGREGRFQLEIRDVRRPFSFVLRGGDDVDREPVYRVEIRVPPRVLAIRCRLAYPEYLGRAPEEVEGGNASVPEGTRVEVRFESDVPVATAQAFVEDQVVPATPEGADERSFSFAFTPTESVNYRIVLRTAGGRESDPAADTYEVRVAPDRAPSVQWLHPRGPVEATPNGRLPFLVEATDDHAVAALDLEIRLADGTTRQHALVAFGADPPDGPVGSAPIPSTDGPLGRETVRAYLALEVKDLVDAEGRAPGPTSRLAARVRVKDSRGQEKEGPWASIDVFGPVELERTLAGRRGGVRTEISVVAEEVKARREQVRALAAGPLGDPEKDVLKSVQFAQAKVVQDLAAAIRGLTDVFNAWVYDRLAAENPTERVLSIFDRHHRATYGVAPAGEADAPAAAGDPVFPWALYDRVVAAWKDRQIFDTGLLDRMLAVLSDAVDATARRAPAAHQAAVRAAAGEVPPSTLAAEQDALADSLERVLEAMRAWQSLNDVIFRLRRILEEQEALDDRLRGP